MFLSVVWESNLDAYMYDSRGATLILLDAMTAVPVLLTDPNDWVDFLLLCKFFLRLFLLITVSKTLSASKKLGGLLELGLLVIIVTCLLSLFS